MQPWFPGQFAVYPQVSTDACESSAGLVWISYKHTEKAWVDPGGGGGGGVKGGLDPHHPGKSQVHGYRSYKYWYGPLLEKHLDPLGSNLLLEGG